MDSLIEKIYIKNYKIYKDFDLDFSNNLNILVGDNESGKSTILEAISLALTKRLNGKLLEYELTPYLFNKDTNSEYIKSIKLGKPIDLPKIIIEVYLKDNPELENLRGTINSKREDFIGIKLEIIFNDDYTDDYADLITNHKDEVKMIPIEYYKIRWTSFGDSNINSKKLPISLSYIDAESIRLQNGTDFYIQDIIKNNLDQKEIVELSICYRQLKENFSDKPSIQKINTELKLKQNLITNKDFSISVDTSNRSGWENNIVPHLDDIPFNFIGRGEQNILKINLAIQQKSSTSDIVLIEEPENHLSFSKMNMLINVIKEKCSNKQVIITTHSAYVINKLGLSNLILLSNTEKMYLKELKDDTQKYFEILPGYDTLRLILSKKVILVEGPSDELIVQKAYFVKNYKLPIENGIDIVCVRGLSFSRFLDIAKKLKRSVAVITDNDGDKDSVIERYKEYTSDSNIKLYTSDDNTLNTLEPNIIGCNELNLLNKILDKKFANKEDLKKYMTNNNNKTDCALKIFQTKEDIIFPKYIEDAINI